ncbi:MAG: hypothetical protein Q8M94_12385, partial [Ignavibacteria bacterium]|nr:hypothetical protein [Ignavibacteria bacterium]
MKIIFFLFLFAVSLLPQKFNSRIQDETSSAKFIFTGQSLNENEISVNKEFFEISPAKKNVALAILYSAMLPGMGE